MSLLFTQLLSYFFNASSVLFISAIGFLWSIHSGYISGTERHIDFSQLPLSFTFRSHYTIKAMPGTHLPAYLANVCGALFVVNLISCNYNISRLLGTVPLAHGHSGKKNPSLKNMNGTKEPSPAACNVCGYCSAFQTVS